MGPRPRGRGCRRARGLSRREHRASMGPRPRGRGCWWCAKDEGRKFLSFNGASSSRTRMRAMCWGRKWERWWLQWGLVLADEDAWGLSVDGRTRGSGASMGPRPRGRGCCLSVLAVATLRRFNGASSSRTRMRTNSLTFPIKESRASMGPRPRRRGCRTSRTIMDTEWMSFNGASSSRTRMLWARTADPTRRGECFNGASSSRTRMQLWPSSHVHCASLLQWGLVLADEDAPSSSVSARAATRRLQWGLVLADEDALPVIAVDLLTIAASMGPRPRGRGCAPPYAGVSSFRTASMGPRPRGRGCGAHLGRPSLRRLASMGPRPRGRGCGALRPAAQLLRRASMGPRPRGRGCGPDGSRHRRGARASMGPRPRGRGCATVRAYFIASWYTELQWGLVLADED